MPPVRPAVPSHQSRRPLPWSWTDLVAAVWLTGTALWWTPVAWWARRRLEETGEQLCDAWVVSAFPELAVEYATTLVESAAFLSLARSAVPCGASGMGQVPLLQRRLTMILDGRIPRNLSWAGGVALLAVAAVLLPLWPTRAEQQAQDPAATPPVANQVA